MQIAILSRCGRYRATVRPAASGSVIMLLRATDNGQFIGKHYVGGWHVLSRSEHPVPFHVALDMAHDSVRQMGDI